MPPRGNILDYAQRATSFGLLGLGIWGIWLTGAVWKSRRGEQGVMAAPGTIADVKARQDADLRRLQMEAQLRENENAKPT